MTWQDSLLAADLPLYNGPPAPARCVRIAVYRGMVSHARAVVGTEPNDWNHIYALARRASRTIPGRLLVFLCEIDDQWLIYDVQLPDSIEQALAEPAPELHSPEDQAAIDRMVEKAKALLQHCDQCATDKEDCISVFMRREGKATEYETVERSVCKACRKKLNGRFKRAEAAK